MITQSLNGSWHMRQAGEGTTLPATVPGSVYADLLANGKMDDPFYRDNEMKALPLMDHDYGYTKTFTPDAALQGCDRVFLRCEGLDTLASLTLNGRDIGKTDNMHRTWEFDLTGLLTDGENTLQIVFSSPTKWIANAHEQNPVYGSTDAMRGFPQLRKAHCMFGWDWGPRLPDMGIWRDITLVGVEQVRFQDVFIDQIHEGGSVALDVSYQLEAFVDAGKVSVSITLTSPDGKVYRPDAQGIILVEDPQKWWPRGLGPAGPAAMQPLYTFRAELSKDGRILDVWEKRIGLRTMTVLRHKDKWGESFAQVCNGVPYFAMGADYIPEDNLLSRTNPQRTRRLLEDAAAANMNTLRVWGGGIYPPDWFYDICDELGLVVWQDMMFACASYELTPELDENIRAEVADNVRRLRHHASLGLWCGNNEMEWLILDTEQWPSTHKQRADYLRIFEYIIPQEVRKHDPVTFYWPASPSSGGGYDDPNDPDRGDVHYWDVWHGNKPFSAYRDFYFRYVSEFGFQSFPCEKTVESFTLPEDRNIFSYIMEKHQRNGSANGRILSYLAQTFLYPAEFGTLLYASQLLQAEAIRYGVEHWRRNRGRCMGAIYWQLNDIWPVASWSSIDSLGRWKALHYYAKRFFAPVLLSCEEEGVITQNTNVNAQAEAASQLENPLKKSARLCVSNETQTKVEGTAHWSLRTPDAGVVKEGSFPVSVEALSVQWLPKLDFSDADTYSHYVSFILEQDGMTVSGGSALFAQPKHFRFLDPKLEAVMKGDKITVKAAAYARAVEIECENGDLLLSDNYFDMDVGERTVSIVRAEGFKNGEKPILRVRSVFDIR